MRRRLARFVVLSGSLVGILAAAPAALAQGAPPAPAVTVAKPVVRDVQETVTFTGRFDAAQSVTIKSRVAGYLQEIRFTDGATVKKGDVLFVIDPRPYQAAVDQADAAVKVSQTAMQFATTDLDRGSQLQKTGNITDQLYDQRRNTYMQAKAKLAGDEAALAAARDRKSTRLNSSH